MERRTKVTVHPPDSRGLRRVSIAGETVGSAWSLRELRRILRRYGFPDHVDLDDRSRVYWQGGGSDVWPDRTPARRATIGLLVAGLVGGWILLTVIGKTDAFDALTFAGRITGFVFLLGGVTEAAAAVAAMDYWGKRSLRISGTIVLLGVVIALTVSTILVFLWLEEMEFTPYMLAVFPLFGWSLWALSVMVRNKVWRGTPHPTKIAAGVTATALLAAVNLAYSSVYQPTAAPANLSFKVRFGTPRADPERPVVHVPLSLQLENTGSVPVYILVDNWAVYGRTARFFEKSTEFRDRRQELGRAESDLARNVGSVEWVALAVGPFSGPGTWYEPGESYSEEKVVEVARNAKFDMLDADLDAMVMRKDRGRIDLDEFSTGWFSWEKESRFYCPPKDCDDLLIHNAQVTYNNNLVNITRKPRYVTAWWGASPTDSNWNAFVSTYKGKGYIGDPASDEDAATESDRFDLFSVTGDAVIPFAAVVNPRP
ncbi:hypothetical protein [Streptomyces sp. NPDC127114]|uniref:hypothetical protein n=1 Tax=Streptomyces sp. NPDC127114 TaxID=3345366 RepID=UPI003625DACD